MAGALRVQQQRDRLQSCCEPERRLRVHSGHAKRRALVPMSQAARRGEPSFGAPSQVQQQQQHPVVVFGGAGIAALRERRNSRRRS